MNASPHRQAILVFGIIAPFFVIGAILVATIMARSKLKETYAEKVATQQRYETAKSQVAELETFFTIDKRRETAEYWNSKLEKDVVESLTANLDKILAKYDSDVLRQTEMGQASGAGSVGPKAKHPYARMQLKFEGGFKPMQLLLAELETEMPQLFLESIAISPRPARSEGEKGDLQFGVVYLAWEKPKNRAKP